MQVLDDVEQVFLIEIPCSLCFAFECGVLAFGFDFHNRHTDHFSFNS